MLVALNPIAGRGHARPDALVLSRVLEASGCDVELLETRAAGGDDGELRAAAARADRAVVIGGDGTFGRVLEVLPRELPVGLLPRGTANVLATDVGLPRDATRAAAAVLAGATTGLDLARVDGRLSFLVTGVGFDGAAVRDVDRRRCGRPITKLFYLSSVLRCLLRQREVPLSVEVDGALQDEPAGWVLVSNVIGYGALFRLSPSRRLDDGLYEVYLFPRATRRALLAYGLRGLLRRLPGGSVKMVRARHVRVTAAEPVPVEVDGDPGGDTPVEIEVAEQQRLIVPEPHP